jgi:peptide/nickel transport system permease protein
MLGLVSALLVSVMIFSVIHVIPGDPAVVMLGQDATPQNLARVRAELGLDRPLPVQYLRWLGRVVQGDLGQSIFTNDRVATLIVQRFPATLPLMVTSLLLAVGIAIPAGVVAATKRATWWDLLVSLIAFAGISIPQFWLGILLILLFSVKWGMLPPGGFVSILQSPGAALLRLILPTIALGTSMAALLTRMVRAGVLEVLGQDYIRTARAKGLSERLVLFRHSLKNALIPVVTVVGLQVGFLLGGAVVVEEVFAWPGLGKLLISAVYTRDFPIVQGASLVIALFFVLVNLVLDLVYSVLDPRIRYS